MDMNGVVQLVLSEALEKSSENDVACCWCVDHAQLCSPTHHTVIHSIITVSHTGSGE